MTRTTPKAHHLSISLRSAGLTQLTKFGMVSGTISVDEMGETDFCGQSVSI